MSWANTPGSVYRRRELRTLDQVEWEGGRERGDHGVEFVSC